MKKIALIFKNRYNMQAIDSVRDIIQDIFTGYANVEKYFADELTETNRISADVFVISDKRLILQIRAHAVKINNIVILTRNSGKDKLDEILKIPEGTDVLIVNDTLESAQEMCYMFYELGICHLNLIPFDKTREKEGIYDRLEYAITPEELQLVPRHLKKVINTGYRKVGFDTLVQIMNVLDLNNESINYNLISYAASIIEPLQLFQISYFSNFLKSQMLNEYVYDSASAIFVCDNEGRVIYYNKHAREIFGFSADSKAKVEDYIPADIYQKMGESSELTKELVNIDEIDYIMNKVSIVVSGQTMGYFVTMQDEIEIKDIESSFSKKLRERGLLAKYTFDDIVYESDTMKECIYLTKKAAASEYTILIRGESGTGKELIAQSIHNYSQRKRMPFVGVNCAAIPESLLESELFGYEEGAFTGARKKGKLGYFEHADRGTIFLDEIGDISPKLQARLLRVIQEKQIMRIGSDKVIDVDVRIIAATNKDLQEEVRKGIFREDLYYRLNALQIIIPPLRERREDIDLLFKKFMGKDYTSVNMCDRMRLREYSWPGNVRELENCALYYKTLHKLPDQLRYVRKRHDEIGLKSEDVKNATLNAIAENSSYGHGIGRTEILRILKDKNHKLSEMYLRKIMAELAEEGYIKIGKGRKATVLSDKGREKLINEQNHI